jgi:hypothetical protein
MPSFAPGSPFNFSRQMRIYIAREKCRTPMTPPPRLSRSGRARRALLLNKTRGAPLSFHHPA